MFKNWTETNLNNLDIEKLTKPEWDGINNWTKEKIAYVLLNDDYIEPIEYYPTNHSKFIKNNIKMYYFQDNESWRRKNSEEK